MTYPPLWPSPLTPLLMKGSTRSVLQVRALSTSDPSDRGVMPYFWTCRAVAGGGGGIVSMSACLSCRGCVCVRKRCAVPATGSARGETNSRPRKQHTGRRECGKTLCAALAALRHVRCRASERAWNNAPRYPRNHKRRPSPVSVEDGASTTTRRGDATWGQRRVAGTTRDTK